MLRTGAMGIPTSPPALARLSSQPGAQGLPWWTHELGIGPTRAGGQG